MGYGETNSLFTKRYEKYKKWVFTFPQHSDLSGSYVTVVAETPIEAKQIFCRRFGKKNGGLYLLEQDNTKRIIENLKEIILKSVGEMQSYVYLDLNFGEYIFTATNENCAKDYLELILDKSINFFEIRKA